MKKKKCRYLFGPVPSRRFGRSLGVDLTPFKTCSLNCVFCQLGRTPQKTILRKAYVPIETVLGEIECWLESGGEADYITLSGSGEPTLHSGFGKVLEFLKGTTAIRSALLTNGTMLSLPDVSAAASYADVVKVSLSAWNQPSFEWINRPHPELQFDRMVEGLHDFRYRFNGELWMEVFLCSGINTMRQDVAKIVETIKPIRPDRIHLNTVVRPPAEDFAVPIPKIELEKLSHLFNPCAEVNAEFSTRHSNIPGINIETILSMLQRRPCTIEQIAEVFGMHINEVSKYLGKLMRNEKIWTVHRKKTVYYTARVEDTKLAKSWKKSAPFK